MVDLLFAMVMLGLICAVFAACLLIAWPIVKLLSYTDWYKQHIDGGR